MTDLLLGVIAFATLAMAVVQVGAILYAARLARRLEAMLGRLERDLGPVVERLRDVSGRAVQASELVVAQLERADRLLADAAARVEATLAIVQEAIIRPAREGLAVVTACRAVFDALVGRRSPAGRPARDAESEEALFIG